MTITPTQKITQFPLTNMPPFLTPAILTSLRATQDGGLSLGFSTQELSDEDKLIAMKYHKQFGYLAFKPNQFALDDMPKEQAEDTQKTPSKRLRAVLFVLWQQKGSTGDFELFYRDRMEKIITWAKGKIDQDL